MKLITILFQKENREQKSLTKQMTQPSVAKSLLSTALTSV